MTYKYGQTAVIVPVPAAEPAVWSWRTRFDTSAHFGVPAHVTVVFPFLSQDRLNDRDLADLSAIFAAEPAFTATFASLKTFTGSPDGPDVLYLQPDPQATFRRLTASLVARWPDVPPYAGIHGDPIPHLTVTEFASTEAIEQARTAVGRHLPITTRLDRGCVLAFDGTQWREQTSLPFGPAAG